MNLLERGLRIIGLVTAGSLEKFVEEQMALVSNTVYGNLPEFDATKREIRKYTSEQAVDLGVAKGIAQAAQALARRYRVSIWK